MTTGIQQSAEFPFRLVATWISRRARLLELDTLVVSTGALCSLHCRDCGNFIPFLTPKLYDIEKLVTDIRLLARVARIKTIQIRGGEALLHPRLGDLVAACLSLDFEQVCIATNGVGRLPADSAPILRDPRVELRISQ